jgi:hypothetical protein
MFRPLALFRSGITKEKKIELSMQTVPSLSVICCEMILFIYTRQQKRFCFSSLKNENDCLFKKERRNEMTEYSSSKVLEQ